MDISTSYKNVIDEVVITLTAREAKVLRAIVGHHAAASTDIIMKGIAAHKSLHPLSHRYSGIENHNIWAEGIQPLFRALKDLDL